MEAAQAERRRIERDLHDGSQQRLVSVVMTLGLADSRLASDPRGAQTFLREARTGLSEALEDLRELSGGIHPGILTERGVAPALDELAARTRLPRYARPYRPRRRSASIASSEMLQSPPSTTGKRPLSTRAPMRSARRGVYLAIWTA